MADERPADDAVRAADAPVTIPSPRTWRWPALGISTGAVAASIFALAVGLRGRGAGPAADAALEHAPGRACGQASQPPARGAGAGPDRATADRGLRRSAAIRTPRRASRNVLGRGWTVR